jgi:gamma-glutamylputrescine oxidase
VNNYSETHHALDAAPLPSYPRIEGQARFDVCVIGAGYTGISTSLHLAELGYNVALVEAQRIGYGASGRNGGQLGYGMSTLQPDLIHRFNKHIARKFWDLSVESVDLFHDLCDKHTIDCDFSSGNMACATSASTLAELSHHADIVEGYGRSVYKRLDSALTQHASGSSAYTGAIISQKSGHINPLKYVLGLAKAAQNAGVSIYEQSRVTAIANTKPATASFETGTITANYLVLCCNGYLGDLSRKLANRILPVDNYQAATQVLDDATIHSLIKAGACIWDTSHSVHYFRLTPDKRLIMGCGIGVPGHPPKNLEKDCRHHIEWVYPQLKDVGIDYIWSGTLAGTNNHLPDVGRLAPHVFYAQGYTGHGVGTAPLTGKYLAQEIHARSSGFKLLSDVKHKNILGGRFLRLPAVLAYILMTNTRDRLA